MDQPATPLSKRRKGIYLLPNLFTTGTLFGGFYAIIASTRGDFSPACVGIMIAMICDSLDGLIARKTNTASDFGKEYDSLCDMVAFGVAASVVSYNWMLHWFSEYVWLGGKLGWVICFTYTACAALRLARFNVLAARGGAKGAFFGLPSPGAAAVVVGMVWAADASGIDPVKAHDYLVVPAALITLGSGILMVTNFRFFSLKMVRLTERVPFRYILFAVGTLALFALFPPYTFFAAFFCYALTGPIGALRRRYRKAPVLEPPQA